MNKRIFGVEVPINELLPFMFTESDMILTQLDYLDALAHAPFTSAVYSDLRKIDINSAPAILREWKTVETGEYRGTWGKRFSKYVKVTYGYNLEANPLSVMLESLAHASKDALTPFYMQFTDHANWKPGMYGDDGSCWWGAQQHSRIGLIEHGGGAILIHDAQQEPFGRLWYYPLQDGDFSAIFNIYDKRNSLTILGISRMLSMKFNISYRRANDLHFPNSYLNGEGSAYLVGVNLVNRPITLLFARKTPVINPNGFLPEDTHIADNNNNDDKICHHCGHISAGDEEGLIRGDDWVCDGCVDELYSRCANCDEMELTGDGEFINADFICEECLDENYFRCEDCETWDHNDNSRWVDGGNYTICEVCYDNNYFSCEDCGRVYHDDNSHHTSDDSNICDNCSNNYTLCDNCSDWTKEPSTILFRDDEQEWCENCADDEKIFHCDDCDMDVYEEHECKNAPDEEEE